MSADLVTVSGSSRVRLGCATAKRQLSVVGTSWTVVRVGALVALEADQSSSQPDASNEVLSKTDYVTLAMGLSRAADVTPFVNTSGQNVNALCLGSIGDSGTYATSPVAKVNVVAGAGPLRRWHWNGAADYSEVASAITGDLILPANGTSVALVFEFNQSGVSSFVQPLANAIGQDITPDQLDRALRAGTIAGVAEYLDDVAEGGGGAVGTRYTSQSTTFTVIPTLMNAVWFYWSRTLRQKLLIRRLRAVKIS